MPLALILRYWKYGAALLVLLGIWLWHAHAVSAAFERGRQEVIAADEQAKRDLREQVAQLTAKNLEFAAAAKATHDAEHTQNLVAAAQPVGTSQLCRPADHRRLGVPEAGPAHPGDAAAPAASAVVQPLPASDHGLADDRSRLLGALAALADDQSAVIREFQGRGP